MNVTAAVAVGRHGWLVKSVRARNMHRQHDYVRRMYKKDRIQHDKKVVPVIQTLYIVPVLALSLVHISVLLIQYKYQKISTRLSKEHNWRNKSNGKSGFLS
jgi:hypothetical protein